MITITIILVYIVIGMINLRFYVVDQYNDTLKNIILSILSFIPIINILMLIWALIIISK